MSKKIRAVFVCAFCCFLFTGCNDVINLTDEQSNLIAEYAAGLLLKYDRNYEDRLEEGKKEEEKQDDVLTSENMKAQITENTEQIVKKTENEMSVQDTEHLSSVGTENDIAKIVDIEGISITYKDYLLTNQYPEAGEEDESIHLEASKGYQLLILRFKIANNTENIAEFSMLDRDIDYYLVCNGSKAAKPMLTILMNDLETLETSVKPGEEEEAVLVYQVSDELKDSLDSINLKVKYNDEENIITIK